jgi:hypothetical protein
VISSAELAATNYRADMGYLWLWVLTGVLLIAAWRMRRWPWLQRPIAAAQAWAARPHWLLWIVVAGALLRIPRMFDSLWYDEAFTARIAGLPAAQFLPAVQGDIHPPLWYALDWLSARLLGMSEAALRFPAYLAGLLLIVYGYRLAKALGLSERVALVYAALIAVLPAALYYSAEARGYTLLAVLAFGALIGLLEERPGVYLVHAALLPLTHNIGFVYLFIFTLVGFWQWRRSVGRVAALSAALVPGALWLPTMLAQSADVVDGFWLQEINLGLFLSAFTDTTVSRMIAPEVAAPVMVIAIMATVIGVGRSWRWLAFDRRGRMLAALAFGVPVVLAIAAWLWAPVYLTRALLPAGLAAALLWALLLVELPLMRVAIPAAVVLALFSFYQPNVSRFNMRAAVDVCADAAGVFVTSIPAAMFAGYYMPAAELRVWDGAGDLNQTLQREAKRAMGLTEGTLDDLPRPACILALDTPQTTAAERALLAEALAAHAHTTTEYWINPFYSVRVIEL